MSGMGHQDLKEAENQAKDSQGPGSVALLQASEENSPSTFPLCSDSNACKGSTWDCQGGYEEKRDHCDNECCKNKTSSARTVLF